MEWVKERVGDGVRSKLIYLHSKGDPDLDYIIGADP